MPITQAHPLRSVGTTRSVGIVTMRGASAAVAPSATALSRSNGSSGPSRSVRIATPNPNVAGATNNSGDATVAGFGPNATAAATTTSAAAPIDRIVAERPKTSRQAISVNTGYVM